MNASKVNGANALHGNAAKNAKAAPDFSAHLNSAVDATKHEVAADTNDKNAKATAKKSAHGSERKDEHGDLASQLLHAMKPAAHASVAMPLPTVAHAAASTPNAASTSSHAKRATNSSAHKPVAHADEAVASRSPSAPDRERHVIETALRVPTTDSSARPATAFSAELARDLPRASDVPVPPSMPAWMPADAVMDDTARMAIFPHALNFTSDNGTMQMRVHNGEVSVRAQGELGVSLRNSESELRVALAQKGLELRESDGTNNDGHPRDSNQRQQQQQNGQETDEWT